MTGQPLWVICVVSQRKRASTGVAREGHGRKWKMNESKETRNLKIALLPLPAARIAGLAQL